MRLPGLRLTASVIAIVAQVFLVAAPLTLAHDEASAAAHVEQGGVDLHHAHNEATCAACRVLSMHGQAQARAHAGFVHVAAVLTSARAPETLARSSSLASNTSRAPPLRAA